MEKNRARVYDPAFVGRLFDRMAPTYGAMNYASSFGFCVRWRRACVGAVGIPRGAVVYDLMSGMGECWGLIDRRLAGEGALVGVDLSAEMVKRSDRQVQRLRRLPITVRHEDFLANAIPDGVADVVVSAFGLKTFSEDQQTAAVRELRRILKPGGTFSLVEISVPTQRALRAPYLFYLHRVIPLLGRLFLGDPACYRLLGVYTEGFAPAHVARCLEEAGLAYERRPLFFGCATLFVGQRPGE